MVFARHMAGWICSGITAIGLSAAVMFTAPVAGAVDLSTTKLDGAYISNLIVYKLASKGLKATPSIKPDRLFPPCDSKPEIEPMFNGWATVAVRCATGSGWRFMIRTNLASRPTLVPVRDFKRVVGANGRAKGQAIEQAVAWSEMATAAIHEIEVVALARSVSRNDIIVADDLLMVAISERNALGAFFDPADVIGRRVKIGVRVNQPLMARHLHPDYLVEEGNEVLISSYAGGISVDMVGYALDNGQFGEWIGVENASSGKAVHAKITGEKKVTVITKK